MRITALFGILMTLLSVPALASSKFNKTDLGKSGNSYVLEEHRQFLASNSTCKPLSQDSYRVVLQGFSLFSGVDMNISGAVVDTFAGIPLEKRSLLEATDHGSRIKQIELEIKGHKVEVCLVVSEVLWDLAAANLIEVIKDFKPDFVLMSGRGNRDATIETGARNQSNSLAGYFYNGTYSSNQNRPRSKRVDPRYESSKVIPSTWNFENIKMQIEADIMAMGQKVRLGKEGRSNNDYICNNIHYSILQAATQGDIELAGGLIKPILSLESIPAIGFFHYPSDTLKQDKAVELQQWKEVITKLISSQLNLSSEL